MFTIKNENVVVVVTRPPSEGWGIAEDHGASEPWKLPRAKTRGCRERKNHKSASGVYFLTGQRRMR